MFITNYINKNINNILKYCHKKRRNKLNTFNNDIKTKRFYTDQYDLNSSVETQILPTIEKSRALLESRISGTLGTIKLFEEESKNESPLYGSLMPYILMNNWKPANPIIILRKDGQHYSNVQENTEVSLVVFPLTPKRVVPSQLPLPKMNMIGKAIEISDPITIDTIKEKFEIIHPGSEQYLKEKELFGYYYIDPKDVYYLPMSGEFEQIDGKEFCRSPVDPIASHSREILEYINENFKDSVILMCKEYGDLEVDDAFIYGVDRRGFDVLGLLKDTKDQWYQFRMPFEREVLDGEVYFQKLISVCKQIISSRNNK